MRARRRHGAGSEATKRPPSAASTAPLFTLLHEDWESHGRSWVHPGFHALAIHRVEYWATSRPSVPAKLVRFVAKAINRVIIRDLYGTDIAHDSVFGRGVQIGHHQGVIVVGGVVVGDGTLIRHNVTLGFRRPNATTEVPYLGRDVQVSPGAQLLGPITVGDGARVGPNAVVLVDVPPRATVHPQPIFIEQPASSTL